MTTDAIAAPAPTGRSPFSLRASVRSVAFGKADAARWERPALLALLALTTILYVWDLSASGWANSFYSAAVQAGATDWTAFFYGSSDAANSITVDKPPASLWIMALSVRLFGLSSWSILIPEAVMGVATVGITYATVRRHFSAKTALLAGGLLAITPVAVLMFRFNNPDALLVLLTTLAVYFTLRGVESGAIRWVIWTGVMVGFAFLTKQLQAFLILPVLAGVYPWTAPLQCGRRMLHALAALGAVILSAGWWVAIVELVPADLRPYIGGSQTNSFLELTFGYNGLGRLTGDETGSVTGGRGSQWGATGILRLFTGEMGGQIAWLLPAALVLFVFALVFLRTAKRTDPKRALLVLLGGWLIVTAVAFSFMAGIFHAYYTVALAPPLAAVVAIGASMLWERRSHLWARIVAAVIVLGTAALAFYLLSLATDWLPWLGYVAVALAVVAGVLLVIPKRGKRFAGTTIALVLVSALVAPTAYSLETVSVGHTGSIVSAGPAVATSGGGGGGPGGGAGSVPAANDNGAFGGRHPAGSTGQLGVGQPGQGGQPGRVGQPGVGQQGQVGPGGTGPNATGQNSSTGAFGAFPGRGGLLGGTTVSSEVTSILSADAGHYRWVAAAIGSNTAASYQLATNHAVMSIGGFNGSDPSPTLAQFQAEVAAGDIHYFVAGEVGRANGGSSTSTEIQSWIETTFTATKIGAVTLYNLSK